MRSHGVAAGDVVAIMLPNQAGFVVTLFAAWRLGAAVTPISPTLVPAEVAYQLTDAGAKILVVEKPLDFDARGAAVVSTGELLSGRPRGVVEPAAHQDDALALLIYTSGTTGRPKGVMLDHANLNAMCRMAIDAFEMTSADHSLLILPLFHVNGIVVGTLSPLAAGGVPPSPAGSARRRSSTGSSRCRATYFSAVPTIYTMLSDLPADVAPDTSSVRFAICGAAPASVELLEQVRDPLRHPTHRRLRPVRGHRAPATVNPLNGMRKPGTVGLPLPGQMIRIVGAGQRGRSAG